MMTIRKEVMVMGAGERLGVGQNGVFLKNFRIPGVTYQKKAFFSTVLLNL
jgi:hypothetical protein